MATYYRDRDVWITSDGIRMNGHEYAHDELRQVWHRRGRRSWGKVAGRGVLGLAILVPLVIGALGIAVSFLLDAPTSVTVGLAGGGVLVGLATLPLADYLLEHVDRSHDRGSRTLEIWGRVPAGTVLLLRTDDRARFGRIYRALQRALEPPVRVRG